VKIIEKDEKIEEASKSKKSKILKCCQKPHNFMNY
jgi:hypothetical protein